MIRTAEPSGPTSVPENQVRAKTWDGIATLKPEGAACESPVQHCREELGSRNKSRRDGTSSLASPQGLKPENRLG